MTQKQFYHTTDPRTLPPEEFQRRAKTNPYIEKIYNYSDLILVHPTPESFQELWSSKGGSRTKTHAEIGCGSGAYLRELSQRFPQDQFVGMELRYKRLVQAARKLRKDESTNVVLLKDYGERLHEYLGKDNLDVLHVNFPDPWAKKAQRKHRLLSADFFNTIHPLFRKGGKFLFKTDHQEYFQSVLELLHELPNYKIENSTTDLHQSPLNEGSILTEFEQLFKSKANPEIGYLEAHAL